MPAPEAILTIRRDLMGTNIALGQRRRAPEMDVPDKQQQVTKSPSGNHDKQEIIKTIQAAICRN